jgi:hypothetical protein
MDYDILMCVVYWAASWDEAMYKVILHFNHKETYGSICY